jgi:hypothetical protein
MAWEKRGNRYYYYRKVRTGKKVASIYVGRGEKGISAWISDISRRRERQRVVQQLLRLMSLDLQLLNILDTFDSQTQEQLVIAYESAGFHKHKGQWRKKR